MKIFCDSKGNDNALKAALKKLLAAHENANPAQKDTYKETRVRQELAFLESCRP